MDFLPVHQNLIQLANLRKRPRPLYPEAKIPPFNQNEVDFDDFHFKILKTLDQLIGELWTVMIVTWSLPYDSGS